MFRALEVDVFERRLSTLFTVAPSTLTAAAR
jgi:hypothetical protein